MAETQTTQSDSAPLVNSEPSMSSTTYSTGLKEFMEAELEFCSVISWMNEGAASNGEKPEDNERYSSIRATGEWWMRGTNQ